MKLALIGASLVGAVAIAGCGGPTNAGQLGVSTVTAPNVTGTVFMIIFENENADTILQPSNPNFYALSHANGSATAYVSTTHPSLPNYIQLTSGSTSGINNDNDPTANIQIGGSANLADQLETAGVPWRAYMESMGEPCKYDSTDLYSAHHDPFLYYKSMTQNPQRCSAHIVDFDQNFQPDLDSGAYKFMWITPNMCNDMHNCSGPVADAWLGQTVAKITASKAYQNGGALFILFDEGSLRILGAAAELATIVMSPNLVSPGFVSQIAYDHRSWLATVEDIFGMPRLPTTVNATPMSAFFQAKTAVQ